MKITETHITVGIKLVNNAQKLFYGIGALGLAYALVMNSDNKPHLKVVK